MDFELLGHMEEKDAYDVVTALRGPDVGICSFATDVKWIFTQRLRYWAGITSISRHSKLTFEALDGTIARLRVMPETPSWWKHWAGHVRDALRAMRALPQFELEATALMKLLEALDQYFYDGQMPTSIGSYASALLPIPEPKNDVPRSARRR